ncbi:MAG TPA: alpha/beta hydrolase [Burkholderiales bacterium]|nr:alpha/beta hydrolase [Burkholderiales bacterium]
MRLVASDGYALGAVLFEAASGKAPAHAAMLCGGGAIPARAYRRVAAWLAARGVPFLTYDNRGIGASRPARMSGFNAAFEDWSDYDCAAAIAWLAQRYPGAELIGVGHSIGCWVLASARNTGSLGRFLFVAPHTGYWGDYHPRWRWLMALMWHGLMPALTRLCGYFPGRALGLGADIPAGFAGQWARRRTPAVRYEGERAAACLERCHRLRSRALALTFTDDGFATAQGARRMLEHLPGVAVEHRVIAPRDVGLASIGHFGVFRASAERALWPAIGDWILE